MATDLLAGRDLLAETQGRDLLGGRDLLALTEQPKKPLFTPQTASQDVFGQVISGTLNTAGFGIPSHLLKAIGYKIPEPSTTSGSIGAGVGNLLGFILPPYGPAKVGAKITSKIFPKLAGGAFLKMANPRTQKIAAKGIKRILSDPKIMRSIGLTMSERGISLGVASGLIAPEEGLFAPVERLKQFGGGFLTGTVFGGMGYIPNKLGRMAAMASYSGLPTTLANMPLEEQIFNYGLGAYFGLHGNNLKDSYKNQVKLGKTIRDGLPEGTSRKIFSAIKDELRKFETEVDFEHKGKPQTDAEKLSDIRTKNTKSFFLYNKNGSHVTKGQNPKLYKQAIRPENIKEFLDLVKQHELNPNTRLRSDDVTWILDRYGTSNWKPQGASTRRKNINKLPDQDLASMSEILRTADSPPSHTIFQPFMSKFTNIWHKTFGTGFGVMERLGMGDRMEEGRSLTSTRVNDDFEAMRFMGRHSAVMDGLKKTIGMRGTRNIIDALQGRISSEKLGKMRGYKYTEATDIIRRYYKALRPAINKHLALYKEKPIGNIENYFTHYEATNDRIMKHMPVEIQQQYKFVKSKRKEFAPGKRRTGALKEYSNELWDVLDMYGHQANYSLNDNFIRKGRKYVNYLNAKEKVLSEQGIKFETIFGVDKAELTNNIEKMIQSAERRPNDIDHYMNDLMQPWNRWMRGLGFEGMEIKSVAQASNALMTMIYGSKMGYRLKLPLRNLGQTMLNIAREGIPATVRGIKYPDSPEMIERLNQAKIYSTRETAYLAGQVTPAGNFFKKGMQFFKWSDLQNVKNSFKIGYLAETNGKIADRGSAMDLKAIARGNKRAAETQWMYLRGNRSAVGNMFRPASAFTTWTANYVEFMIASAAPEYRGPLMQYLATTLGLIGISALAGIKGVEYGGLSSPMNVARWVQGDLPIAGIAENPFHFGIWGDTKRFMKTKDPKELVAYTLNLKDDEPFKNPLRALGVIQ